MAYLARRDYARSELREKLIATGASRDEADAVLDEIAGLGYLSDTRFANALVRKMTGVMCTGDISASLKAMGVPA